MLLLRRYSKRIFSIMMVFFVAIFLPFGVASNYFDSIYKNNVPNMRNLNQDGNCTKNFLIELSSSNINYIIWDEQGKMLYGWPRDEISRNYLACHDSRQCYTVSMWSYDENPKFDYKIVLNGNITTNTINFGSVVRVGNCLDLCNGDAELWLSTYDLDGSPDTDFSFQNKNFFIEGRIDKGDSKRICLNLNDCNLLKKVNGGHSGYIVYENGIDVKSGTIPLLLSIGDCTNCKESTILLTGKDDDTSYNFNVESNSLLLEEGIIRGGEFRSICIKNKECTSLSVDADVGFYLFNDGVLSEDGIISYYKTFGDCPMQCDEKPHLGDSRRGLDIILYLSTISGMEYFNDLLSPQYRAACWIIFDDALKLDASDPSLTQRYIMALLYFNTDGMEWLRSLGFLSPKPECEWTGIICKNNFINSLTLTGNNLAGSLASELYYLSSLESLDLSENQLRGTLGQGISRLNIVNLNIWGNHLSGSIPEEIFLNEKLETLYLQENFFTGTIPITMKDHPNLHVLYLESNSLTGTIPSEICTITDLEILNVFDNELMGVIPNNVADLSRLKSFDVASNRLSGSVPPTLLTMAKLTVFNVANNRLTGFIPFEITNKSSLISLKMNGNLLNGTVPLELSLLTNLKELSLAENSFHGPFPEEIQSLKTLEILEIEKNEITGVVAFENCEQFTKISSDCAAPWVVDCKCCNICYGFFSSIVESHDCPSSELTISISSSTFTNAYFNIRDSGDKIVIQNDIFYTKKNIRYTYNACVSETDCFKLDFAIDDRPIYYNISINDKILFLNALGDTKFGYNQQGSVVKNSCHDYTICDRIIESVSHERNLINFLTGVSGTKVFEDKASPECQAVKWWLDDIKRFENLEKILIQRYLLALFYYSTVGVNWNTQTNWLSEENECNWYGVYCEIFPNVIVSRIELKSNNLGGTIPTTIGNLEGLQILFLNDNNLGGTIPSELFKLAGLVQLNLSTNFLAKKLPSEIAFLNHLTELDISSNSLTSTLPEHLGLLGSLANLNLSNNSFSGELSDSLGNLISLKNLSVSSNLLTGDTMLIRSLRNLEYLDLSKNFFTGKLPIFGNSQAKLKRAYLNQNNFAATIASDIGEMISLEELFLQSNLLTGSIPTQISNLANITKLSLSYNKIKGTLSPSVSKLHKLNLFHLHRNDLEGEVDYFHNQLIDNFIADCGYTFAAGAKVTCEGCSECCNEEGGCLRYELTWPKGVLLRTEIDSGLSLILIMFFSCLAFILVLYGLQKYFRFKIPSLPYFVRLDFQAGSVYKFFLANNTFAFGLAGISIFLQSLIFFMFVRAADFNFIENEWQYSLSCTANDMTCLSTKLTTWLGWAIFGLVLFLFLSPDLLDGSLMLYEGLYHSDFKAMLAGSMVLYITILSIIASTIYNAATGLTNTDIIKDVVLLLFLNNLDEQIYMIVQRMRPFWVEKIEKNIILSYDEWEDINVEYRIEQLEHDLRCNEQFSNGLEQDERKSKLEIDRLKLQFEKYKLETEQKLHVEINKMATKLRHLQTELSRFDEEQSPLEKKGDLPEYSLELSKMSSSDEEFDRDKKVGNDRESPFPEPKAQHRNKNNLDGKKSTPGLVGQRSNRSHLGKDIRKLYYVGRSFSDKNMPRTVLPFTTISKKKRLLKWNSFTG